MKRFLPWAILFLVATWTTAPAEPAGVTNDGTGNSSQGGKTLQVDAPALRPIVETSGLPRVLLLGDSISIGYTIPVRNDLAGVANVCRPPTNCGDTKKGLANIDQWLGEGKWDVIHFNWGLHDLKVVPTTHQQNNPPAEYEKNLRALVARLKATGATLIFATTTPVPVEDHSPLPHSPADVTAYNEIAVKLMTENGIQIDDLYSTILPHEAETQIPNNVHYKPTGWHILGDQVAVSIREVLKVRNGSGASPEHLQVR